MVKKSVKKPVASATAKKPTAKKAAAKKTTRATVKPVVAPEMVASEHTCKCGGECHCGANCQCGTECACHTCKHGSRFWRFVKKLIIFIIIFALGFAAAKFCPCNHHPRAPRLHFVNGCVDVASVKCPKLAAALPAMDINQDGCITREEYKLVKQKMRREIREMQVQVAE